jgi:ankyrin repeat protein
LHHAAFEGSHFKVKKFLENGARIDARNNRGQQAIHLMNGWRKKKMRWTCERIRATDMEIKEDGAVYFAHLLGNNLMDHLLFNFGANPLALDDENNLPFFTPAQCSNLACTFSSFRAAVGAGLFPPLEPRRTEKKRRCEEPDTSTTPRRQCRGH